jgi:hypothetical protein
MTLAFTRTIDWASSGNRSTCPRPDLQANVAAIDQPERRQRIPEPCGLDAARRIDAQDADNRQVFRVLRECRTRGAKSQREGQGGRRSRSR